MRTSLSSFLLSFYSLNEAIKHIAMAGFDAVDIWGGRPHAIGYDLSNTISALLHDQLDDFGLESLLSFPTNVI